MKRYRVCWVELHETEVDALNEEQAYDLATDESDCPSRKNCQIEYTDDLGESEPDEMWMAKLSKE